MTGDDRSATATGPEHPVTKGAGYWSLVGLLVVANLLVLACISFLVMVLTFVAGGPG